MILPLLFILGLCIGSFLNVLIDRLPKGENVICGRSHCDFCRHKLLWYELIPLFSFLMQQGKSRCCKKRLSLQYPLVELATGIGFVLIYSSQMDMQSLLSIVRLISYFVLLSSFIVIFVSDLKYEIIPIEMIIVGFFTALFFHFINFTNFTNFMNFCLSALGTGVFFFALWFFTKKKAMGDGDIYLASLLGFILGYPDVIIALYTAFLTGAVAGVILILGKKKSLKSHIPFGPFLIWGYVITLLFGNHILELWSMLW